MPTDAAASDSRGVLVAVTRTTGVRTRVRGASTSAVTWQPGKAWSPDGEVGTIDIANSVDLALYVLGERVAVMRHLTRPTTPGSETDAIDTSRRPWPEAGRAGISERLTRGLLAPGMRSGSPIRARKQNNVGRAVDSGGEGQP